MVQWPIRLNDKLFIPNIPRTVDKEQNIYNKNSGIKKKWKIEHIVPYRTEIIKAVERILGIQYRPRRIILFICPSVHWAYLRKALGGCALWELNSFNSSQQFSTSSGIGIVLKFTLRCEQLQTTVALSWNFFGNTHLTKSQETFYLFASGQPLRWVVIRARGLFDHGNFYCLAKTSMLYLSA